MACASTPASSPRPAVRAHVTGAGVLLLSRCVPRTAPCPTPTRPTPCAVKCARQAPRGAEGCGGGRRRRRQDLHAQLLCKKRVSRGSCAHGWVLVWNDAPVVARGLGAAEAGLPLPVVNFAGLRAQRAARRAQKSMQHSNPKPRLMCGAVVAGVAVAGTRPCNGGAEPFPKPRLACGVS